jgi:hypothetical protein
MFEPPNHPPPSERRCCWLFRKDSAPLSQAINHRLIVPRYEVFIWTAKNSSDSELKIYCPAAYGSVAISGA